MKTTYAELLKRATPGPFMVSSKIEGQIITDGHKSLAEMVSPKQSRAVTHLESESNAALLVHSANVLPEVRDKLTNIQLMLGRLIDVGHKDMTTIKLLAVIDTDVNAAIAAIENVEV